MVYSWSIYQMGRIARSSVLTGRDPHMDPHESNEVTNIFGSRTSESTEPNHSAVVTLVAFIVISEFKVYCFLKKQVSPGGNLLP